MSRIWDGSQEQEKRIKGRKGSQVQRFFVMHMKREIGKKKNKVYISLWK